MELSAQDRKELLHIARERISNHLDEIESGSPLDIPSHLLQPSGVFVTLRIGEELRGCIGYIEALKPLAIAVSEIAEKAAFEDPRFLPLELSEIESVEIEISVLSPLTLITEIEDIIIGKHGLVIDAGYARGLLLPHVAREFFWTREQFLDHTCAKAGLPPLSWKKSDVKIFAFTTETFSEKDFEKE